MKQIIFWLLWVGFISYAMLLAPPDQPDTVMLITNLSTGKLADINPLIVALFNIMGILPMIYMCLLLIDGRGQKIRAFPFALGAFGVGAFALLPYLALRQPNPEFKGKKNLLLKILDSRLLGIILTLGSGILVFYGLKNGDWSDFISQWQTSRFIHVMSLDFCLLSLLFPVLVGDDMARRGMKNQTFFWVISLLPLFGTLLYLCVRSPLAETSTDILSDNLKINE